MANKLYEESSIKAIADAIRLKNNSTDTYKVGQMSDAIKKIGTQDFVVYDGEYDIMPTTEDQTFSTAQKIMLDNLVVEKIPYAEVSNASNGTTAIIG